MTMKTIFLILFLGMGWMVAGQPSDSGAKTNARKTWCNPVDINYQYDPGHKQDHISYRSGADPVIVDQEGEYYLFVTNSGGYWHSNDLLNWTYIRPNLWPAEDMCAPAAVSVRDTLYLCQSTFGQRPIYYFTDPESGQMKYYNRRMPLMPGALGPWDPDLFYDKDTDRWFMYFGSSNFYPIYGIELDHNRKLTYIGKATPLLYIDPEHHGWERFGPNHTDTIHPYIEGAWMTKYNGKYYLQYAAPGTEYNVYANGVYTGDDPLGPFAYEPYNPVSYKPGGFMAGAGHGNTFQDNYGNYWNTGTPWVAVNWKFERRIAMFPAGFDRDGHMFSNTRFGDFPHYLPDGQWTDRNALFTGWMLLSYGKPCSASSTLDTMAAGYITDENPRTFWVARSPHAGEWISVDLLDTKAIRAVQVNYTDYRSGIYYSDPSYVYNQFRLYYSVDGKTWQLLADLSGNKTDRPDAYIELPAPVRGRFVKFENVYVPTPYLAISDIRIFGHGNGSPPATPANLSVVRHQDQRNATVRWDPVPGAVGYNILWGIATDKLYQTYQVWADKGDMLELRALNTGQEYYFSIEAFNENGVSESSSTVLCR
jgi:xylan 1,4-beta-xylosidase